MVSSVCTILNFRGCWYCRGKPRGSANFNAGSVVFSKSDSEALPGRWLFMRSSAEGVYGMSASVPGFARVLLHDDFPPPSHTPEMSGCRGAAGAAGRSEQPDTNVTAASNPANAIKNGYRTCKISLLRKLPQYSRLELSAVGEHYLDQIPRRSASQARMEGYGHGISHFERSSTPTSLGQDSRGTGLEKPLPARAVGIHGLNTDLHMRIAPDELGNGRLHRRLLLRLIYQCAAVVRQGWDGHQQGAGGNGQHAEHAGFTEAARFCACASRHGTSNR